jgi:hypothetical protein
MFSAARPAGFEPATCGFEGRRRTQWTPRTYPLCDPNLILFNEAVELLKLAKDGKGVDAGRAERFARGDLEATEMGRMAIAVLDGGLFAGARLVELAEASVSAERGRELASLTPTKKA